MGQVTGIEWTDATWNPWQGCQKVSPGCKNCYMYRDKIRYGQDPKTVVRSSDSTFYAPLKWPKIPKRVFTCSWSDFFIDQADEWRDAAWNIIRQTPHLTYQILTKRPENIKGRLPNDWGNGWPNVWLGVSVESPKYHHRIITLSDIPTAIHFVSYEPALELVDFAPSLAAGWIDWLIAGGESGYSPRLANPDWFRQTSYDCRRFGVPFFFKQFGGSRKIDGAWGGRLLGGREWNEMPQREAVQ